MTLHHPETEEEFDQIATDAGSKLIVIDFFATWCPPCVRIGPFFKSLAEEEKYSDSCVFVKIDVDKAGDLSKRFKIRCMPTFKFVKDGEELETLEGASEEKLVALIAKHSGKSE